MYILCSGTSVFRSCFSVWREKLFVLEYFGIVYNTYIYRRVAPAMYIMPENSNNEGRWTPKKHPPKYILRIKSSSKCVSMNDACVYAQCESISFDFLLVICQLNLLFAVFSSACCYHRCSRCYSLWCVHCALCKYITMNGSSFGIPSYVISLRACVWYRFEATFLRTIF